MDGNHRSEIIKRQTRKKLVGSSKCIRINYPIHHNWIGSSRNIFFYMEIIAKFIIIYVKIKNQKYIFYSISLKWKGKSAKPLLPLRHWNVCLSHAYFLNDITYTNTTKNIILSECLNACIFGCAHFSFLFQKMRLKTKSTVCVSYYGWAAGDANKRRQINARYQHNRNIWLLLCLRKRYHGTIVRRLVYG